ncbi:cytochrome c oxidase assembly protein [Aurantimonas marina]|uniref:cytochrome c oxidase assembly protein n=1 Tax=Aurantimonas marina TaxID=2780508 RepID=UPI0019CF5CA4|nr:cytochrome c oxidase assembly protein [Aurantimonas marina]
MSGGEHNPTRPQTRTAGRKGIVIAVSCAAFAVGMIGAAYASVPLYQLFCQVTGYGGTTQRAETGSSRVIDRTVIVRFDGNVSGDLPWAFQPNDRQVTVKLGETREVSYRVKNNSDKAVTGQATFNVTPNAAGVYFNKIACFCFDNQTLQPGEELDMPIVFYVDPDMLEADELKNAPGITLSYTFFKVDDADESVAAAPEMGAGEDTINKL